MNLNILKPRKALNKAFLKVKPNRTEIESFKQNLIKLTDHINEAESEEFHKNIVSTFLKDTYYKENHFINTKGRNDLVIHNGKDAKSTVGVIIEAKKPTNKPEMLKTDNINTKAFQELVLYYLRERITGKNLDVKYLIATNIYEWFVFDAQLFDKLFAHNKTFVNQFSDFEENRLSVHKTDSFYKEIAEPFINEIKSEITFTHFDIRDFNSIIRNADKQDDSKLIALYKLLSPEHLLKLPFVNDSNSLDKRFYSELLHIIGLTETKEGSKKLIERKKEGERNAGSLIENAIIQLDSLDKISRLEKPYRFGETNKERLFNVALELAITWVNRILFLKLLEAQLISYHKGDKSYSFLNTERVKNYDDLNNLFFQVLARLPEERNAEVKTAFAKVPYLNSSLFEPTPVEHSCLFISQLSDKNLPILSTTVLKDTVGKKRTGEIDSLEYFFEFLDAYDFTSEGQEEIQEDNKTLINASVLGLIFEKINGYKDGSFFTPSFITMYMCRETIRRAVVQKFNEAKSWNCQSIDELYDKIEDKKEANQIINSIKICDPAVGSGHFLVSALNEIIAVKSELRVLLDRNGKRLKEYHVEVENDELMITDEDGEFLEYNPHNPESQRVQETLFHEKQTIIESCLFGVDINPNSVKICRLRLWIELLKNAYYKQSGELETLPNIDINIKCGNSLISRYSLDADIKTALKRSKWSIDSYRIAVMTYRNAQTKDEKRAMERLIDQIKSDFESEVAANDKRLFKLSKAKGDLLTLTTQTTLFDRTKAEKATWEKQVKALTETIKNLETELEEIRNNKIYENAFEWRFEFPEVLNNEGDFVGFDVVIGNPPYIKERDAKEIFYPLRNAPQWENYIEGKMDLWYFFLHLAFNISHTKSYVSYITNSYWMKSDGSKKLINRINNEKTLYEVVYFDDYPVFEEVSGKHMIHTYYNSQNIEYQVRLLIADKKNFKGNIDEIEVKKTNSNDVVLKDSIQIEHSSNSIFQGCPILDNFYFVSQGVVEAPDKLSSKNIPLELRGTFSAGSGIFVVNKSELDELELNKDEYTVIKKYLNSSHLVKYGIDFRNEYLIFSDKETREKIAKGEYPNLKKHLDKYNHFITSSNAPYGLHRDRSSKENPFEIPKLICKGMFATPEFTYDDEGYYVGFSFSIINQKDKNYSLKYLLALMNSKLGNYWFQINGKKRGIGVDIGVKVFRLFPVKELAIDKQRQFIDLVEKILYAKRQNFLADTTDIENQIDQLVYQIYGLSEGEIKIVESC